MQNIPVERGLILKLLPGHKVTHTHTGPIALPGPLKWSIMKLLFQFLMASRQGRESRGAWKLVAQNLERRRLCAFVTLVRSAVYKLSYLLTYLLTYANCPPRFSKNTAHSSTKHAISSENIIFFSSEGLRPIPDPSTGGPQSSSRPSILDQPLRAAEQRRQRSLSNIGGDELA